MASELTLHVMGRLIGEALDEDGMTQAEFCRRVGTSTKHLNQVISGKATAHVSQLDYWAFVLGRTWSVALGPVSSPPKNSEDQP
jgi:transcriptional regulator with XRE-family HTH domain